MLFQKFRAPEYAFHLGPSRCFLEENDAASGDIHLTYKKRVFFIRLSGGAMKRPTKMSKLIRLARKEAALINEQFIEVNERVTYVRPKPPPPQKVEKPPPAGKHGSEWTKIYEAAVKEGNPFPEKFADSAMRARELKMKIESNRHILMQCNKKPGKEIAEQPVVTTCEARTMAGTKCGFKAVCGKYCKKHAPKK